MKHFIAFLIGLAGIIAIISGLWGIIKYVIENMPNLTLLLEGVFAVMIAIWIAD